MDAFEAVIASILQRRGFWTQVAFKVELTTAEKRRINRPSSPRWELDVIAYRGKTHELLVMECKSFLDSPGVRCSAFDGSKPSEQKRYKLFFDATLRRVVLARLVRQLEKLGFCPPRPKVRLGLAAGKIHGDTRWLEAHFDRKGWILWGPTRIRAELEGLRDVGFEDSVAAIVAKLLLREQRSSPNDRAKTRLAI